MSINYSAYNHAHPLLRTAHSGTHLCDVCRSHHSTTYFCSQCNYDECLTCFPRTSSRSGGTAAPAASSGINYQAYQHAHPLAQTHHSSPHVCDVCRNSSPVTYFCGSCNYDECPTCFPRTRSTAGSSAPTINYQAYQHAHPLVNTSHAGTHMCDVCKQQSGSTYFCASCNYDECPSCFPRTRSTAGTAAPTINYQAYQHAHPLVNTSHAGTHMCDVCKQHSGSTYFCASCNYDECPSCFPRTRSTAGTAAPTINYQAYQHAHPLINTSHAGTHMCDVCKQQSGSTYFCASCNYDECPSCFPRTRSTAGTAAPTINYQAYQHAHPLVQTNHAGTHLCDVCKSSSPVTYYCASCNYDECPSCFPRTRSTAGTAAPTINYQAYQHAHPLVRTTHSGTHLCDVCKTSQPVTYYCSSCNYDECTTCFPRTRSTAGTAPTPTINYSAFNHAHGLVEITHKGTTRLCDVCRQPSATTFMCSACNYDECPSCFPRTSSRRA